jgi:16S rRNA (adenine1518-N6/adenine1519-N6)-dimethyltransferase
MTPAELRELLGRHGIRPVRDRGQHFLLDESVVAAMADAAGVSDGDRVLEIGPGPGILTETLLSRGAEVVAVEIDRRLASLLRERFAPALSAAEGSDAEGPFRLVEGDALSFANADLAARFSRPGAYKVVANLPYGITTDALMKFIEEEPRPSSMTVMVQREVADRILAGPGEMNALAVAIRSAADADRVVNVPRGAFLPPPRVDSAVIHIRLWNAGERERFLGGADPAVFSRVVRAAFAAKRKKLRNGIAGIAAERGTDAETALVQAKIDPSARPEEVGLGGWAALARSLTVRTGI